MGVGAKNSLLKLMKKADPARRRWKGRGLEVGKPLTLRVYKEDCSPSSRIAFLFISFTQPLC